jgi:cytochrome c-type biogenesis protein CcmE
LLSSAQPGKSYQLTGKVVAGYTRNGTVTNFRVRDRSGKESVPVRYVGVLPDPFRAGREVIVDVRKEGHVFVGEKDSLVTKCPSKFTAEKT